MSSRHRRTERRKALPWPLGDRERLRQELHDRHPNCHWCGARVRIITIVRDQRNPDDMATLEHLVPECFGGAHGGNMVLACMQCNSMRSNYPSLKEALRVHIESAKERIAGLVAMRTRTGLTQTQKWRLKGSRQKLRKYQAFAARVAEGPFTPSIPTAS